MSRKNGKNFVSFNDAVDYKLPEFVEVVAVGDSAVEIFAVVIVVAVAVVVEVVVVIVALAVVLAAHFAAAEEHYSAEALMLFPVDGFVLFAE